MTETEQEKFDYLEGEMHGVRAVLCALIDSHQDRAKFVALLELSVHIAQAKTEALPVSENYLEGQRDIVQEMKTYAMLPPAPLKKKT